MTYQELIYGLKRLIAENQEQIRIAQEELELNQKKLDWAIKNPEHPFLPTDG